VSAAIFVVVLLLATSSGCTARRADDNSQVTQYLNGPGRLVLTFRQLSAPLLSIRSGTAHTTDLQICEKVASRLNKIVNPTTLGAEAAKIPDSQLAQVALDERTVRSSLLVACGQGDTEKMTAELTRAHYLNSQFTKALDSIS